MLLQGLQHSGKRLQGALARLASNSAAAEQLPMTIPAEVAQLVSLRGGLAALPATVEAAVDQVAAGARFWKLRCQCTELAMHDVMGVNVACSYHQGSSAACRAGVCAAPLRAHQCPLHSPRPFPPPNRRQPQGSQAAGARAGLPIATHGAQQAPRRTAPQPV